MLIPPTPELGLLPRSPVSHSPKGAGGCRERQKSRDTSLLQTSPFQTARGAWKQTPHPPTSQPWVPCLMDVSKLQTGEKPQLVNGPQMRSSTLRLGACAGEGLLPQGKEAQEVGGAKRRWRAVGVWQALGNQRAEPAPSATGQRPPLRQNAQRQRLGGVGRARGPPRLHSPKGAPRPPKTIRLSRQPRHRESSQEGQSRVRHKGLRGSRRSSGPGGKGPGARL